MTLPLAILYEHPLWFEPLFSAFDRRGIDVARVRLDAHHFDPAGDSPPAPVVFNRIAMSAPLREPHHGIFYATALLDHWQRAGARVVNGSAVLSLDASKARQLSLVSSLGLAVPRTRIVHRPQDTPKAAAEVGFPLLVKANIGGAGAGIVRFDSLEELQEAVARGALPTSEDKVLLVQEVMPARGGHITRLETLAGRFLYALDVAREEGVYDLCPADVCMTEPGKPIVTMTRADPPAAMIEAAERIVQAAGIEVGGVEAIIDDRDGSVRFFDVNALSNFVADPLNVLGWDPHERLVDYLEQVMREAR
jgi:hypothetical protein